MSNAIRRIVSTLVAILIAASTVLVCAPAPAAAAAGHCQPAANMKPTCSHCPQKSVMDCCATSMPQPAVPQDRQNQGAAAAAPVSLVPADAVAIAASHQVPDLARALRDAPPHGYHSTDLRTLNAVFLI